ncbi:MAG: hypothetical protein AVDCRST_MAG91-993 [uncultured Sphingomonadaceae bacterium]|uniref:Uncharacterized protein n=1 Tax=uncultured Sphingomonadaceae bacterium TaxID=169976 RepID=A0A6J4SPB5_9SPHN|nr:MAG: hypothetical protein AVDCRST_MAG91-993 [uncultured Sphingomonadaceae bacterium]
MRMIGVPEPERSGYNGRRGTEAHDGDVKYPALVRTTLILGTCALGWSAAVATVQYLW